MNASPRPCTPDQMGCDFGSESGPNCHVFLSMTEPCCGSTLSFVNRHQPREVAFEKFRAWNLVNAVLAILAAPSTCRRTGG